MKLGATVTSERGKAVTKTANEFLIISIKDDNQETIGYIKIESQTDSIGDKIKVNYSFVDRVYVSEHKKTNENLKHDKHINGCTGEICNGLCQCNCHYI